MLMDKGYYDYDYTEPKKKAVLNPEDREIWSAAKLDAILGVKRKSNTPPTDEEIQAAGLEFLKDREQHKR
ncbi:MAG: hypothetical protein K2K82_04205 [Muribaculaceae bacterium]|nr:hypothetical protein [Muribaculaceae bacterium]